MSTIPSCPTCQSTYVYEDQLLYICPECSNEWPIASKNTEQNPGFIVKDAYGTVLNEGDSVTVIKDLKVKGASSSIKMGTKVKDIHLIEGDHNIDCKIPGFGGMQLKSEFVKKN